MNLCNHAELLASKDSEITYLRDQVSSLQSKLMAIADLKAHNTLTQQAKPPRPDRPIVPAITASMNGMDDHYDLAAAREQWRVADPA